MGWLKDFVVRLLKIKPATNRRITIKEPLTFHENVLKNQIWYRGEPAELEQFFKQTAVYDTDKSRFWASVPSGRVRKIHSGIVGIVIDRYRDIIIADMDGIKLGKGNENHPIQDTWDKIAEKSNLNELVGEGITGALASGDGAFKVSLDGVSQYPVIEFYEADRVCFVREGRALKEIKFYTSIKKGEKEHRLEETYGIGYVKYKLFSETGKEISMQALEETRELADVEYNGEFIMAVPLIIFPSNKWKGRGKPLFGSKTDSLDSLDEVISQWLDAVRMGRVKRYIPEDLIPRDPDTGALIEAKPFDNDFVAVGAIKSEGESGKIDISQPQISYEAYINSYASFLDLVLQGIISPATLGIDMKKTDNAEAQREKEKITLHIRGKIVEALTVAIPKLAETILKVCDLTNKPEAGEYEASIKFGEYASPDFDSTVDTVVKAKNGGVMSVEQSVEEMYGDTWTEEEKNNEIIRLKTEQGIINLEEPGVNMEEAQKDRGGQQLLNGAQLASLMNVIKMVKEGNVSRSEAIAIIISTLGISRENAETFIMEGIQNESKDRKSDLQYGREAVFKDVGRGSKTAGPDGGLRS